LKRKGKEKERTRELSDDGAHRDQKAIQKKDGKTDKYENGARGDPPVLGSNQILRGENNSLACCATKSGKEMGGESGRPWEWELSRR